jgi:DNA-binding MarR family transcriptional regulator
MRNDQYRPDEDAELARRWASVVRGVLAVQQSFSAGIESAGVSLPYVSVLTLLLEADGHRLPMSRIARELSMTTGGFTKLADRMGRDGLIDRRGSAGDRRVVFAALTDVGLQLARRAQQQYHRLLHEEVLSVLTASELRTMADAGERLAEAHRAADTDPQLYRVTSPEPGSAEPRRRSSD